MSIDPIAKNINLSTQNIFEEIKIDKVMNGAAARLIEEMRSQDPDASQPSNNDESNQTSFTENDGSAVYRRLQQKGLNNLRSEIIAVCEFVPITTGLEDENAQNNFKLGQTNSISVTSVSKIMELHRQIRDYTTEAANQVLSSLYPDITNSDFINFLQGFFKDNFETFAKSTVEETVNSLFDLLQERAPTNFAGIINSNRENPFMLGVIEYFIYENILDSVMKFLGSVSALSGTVGSLWQIHKYPINGSFNKNTVFETASDIALKNIFTESSTSALFSSNPDDVLRKVLGIDPGQLVPEITDLDVFCNAVGALVSVLSFVDSSLTLSTLSQTNALIDPGIVRVGATGDLAEALGKLKNIPGHGMLIGLPGNILTTLSFDLGRGRSENQEFFNEDSYSEIFRGMKTASGERISGPHNMSATEDLLVAMCYDLYTFDISNLQASNIDVRDYLKDFESEESGQSFGFTLENFGNFSGKTPGFSDGAQINESSGLIYSSMIKSLLGAPDSAFKHPASTQSGVREYPRASAQSFHNALMGSDVDRHGFGFFGNSVTPIKTIESSDGDSGVSTFVPLSGDGKDVDNPSLLPSVDHYINDVIFNSADPESLSFDNLTQFSQHYNKMSTNLVQNVLTLYPNRNITDTKAEDQSGLMFPTGDKTQFNILIKMLEALTDDIHALSDDFDTNLKLPMLSVFLRDTTDKNIAKMYTQIFWDILYCNQKFEVFENSGNYANNQMSAVQMGKYIEYVVEDQCRDFFRNTCGFSFRNAGKKKRKFKFGDQINTDDDADSVSISAADQRGFQEGREHEYDRYIGKSHTVSNALFYKEHIIRAMDTKKSFNSDGPPNVDGNVTSGRRKMTMDRMRIDNKFNESAGPRGSSLTRRGRTKRGKQ